MPRWILGVALLAFVSACGGRGKAVENSGATQTTAGGNFVLISLDDEEETLESLMGSELMTAKAVAHCGDLVKLEPSAMLGRLNDGEIRCLETSLRETDRQTVKDKIGRVLMNDAWAKGDRHRWESVAERHLEEVDQSDPEICYKMALHISRAYGPERSDDAMHWAQVALENRHEWEGDIHVERVYALYKIRAHAASAKWQWFEEQYVVTPTQAGMDDKEDARIKAKTLAREWLEYARAAGKDDTKAFGMCVSTAGVHEFCAETQ